MNKDKRICPKCKSIDIKYWETLRSENVGWSDGLGSPGAIYFSDNNYKCKQCGLHWKE